MRRSVRACLAVIASAWCAGSAAFCPAQEVENTPVPRWELLDFTDFDDDDRRITSVKLLLREYALGEPQLPRVAVESKDPIVLRRVEKGLATAWCRPRKRIKLAGGGEPYGELLITTTDESFKVYLYHRFVLESAYENNENGFVSWILARTISDLLTKHGGEQLTADQFEALSGEGIIQAAAKTYEQVGRESTK
jgi:hypothetical protein